MTPPVAGKYRTSNLGTMCLFMEKKMRLNRFVGSNLGPNCLQRLSADGKSHRLTTTKQTIGPRSFVPEKN